MADSNSTRCRLIPIVACLLTACATNGEWTRSDTLRQSTYSAMIAADAVTTARIHEAPGVHEAAPITQSILGRQPDPSDTAVYFATVAITHWMISRALPPKWRRRWQIGGTVLHGHATYVNCGNNLC